MGPLAGIKGESKPRRRCEKEKRKKEKSGKQK